MRLKTTTETLQHKVAKRVEIKWWADCTLYAVLRLTLKGNRNFLNFINDVYWITWVKHITTQEQPSLFWWLSAWLHSQDLNRTNEGNPVCGLFWTRTWKHKQTNSDIIWPHIFWLYCSNSTVTWKQGWWRCCPAVGGQACASRGRRTEEGSPSDTGTASAVSLHPLSAPSTGSRHAFLPPCLVLHFQVQLLALRMWNETGSAPAEGPGWLPLLNNKNNHVAQLCLNLNLIWVFSLHTWVIENSIC